MTVEELIKKLEEYPKDALIIIKCDDFYCDVEDLDFVLTPRSNKKYKNYLIIY